MYGPPPGYNSYAPNPYGPPAGQYGQPMIQQHFYPPQPPPPLQPIYVLISLTKHAAPISINIANNSSNNNGFNNPRDLGCPFCQSQTQTVFMKKPGNVTYLWCFCLFILTTGILCCVPFCIDSCKDTHLVCVRCKNSK